MTVYDSDGLLKKYLAYGQLAICWRIAARNKRQEMIWKKGIQILSWFPQTERISLVYTQFGKVGYENLEKHAVAVPLIYSATVAFCDRQFFMNCSLPQNQWINYITSGLLWRIGLSCTPWGQRIWSIIRCNTLHAITHTIRIGSVKIIISIFGSGTDPHRYSSCSSSSFRGDPFTKLKAPSFQIGSGWNLAGL